MATHFLPRLTLLGVLLALLGACGGGGSQPAAFFLLADGATLREVGPDGETVRLLVELEDGHFLRDPALSPDRRRVAFVVQPPARTDEETGELDFGSDLYLVDRDGANLQLLLEHAEPAEFLGKPVWVRGGRAIVFEARGISEAREPDLRLEEVDLESGARRRLVPGGVLPAIAPSGALMAFVLSDPLLGREDLVLGDPSGSNLSVAVAAESGLTFFSALAFSPDGTIIAFSANGLLKSEATPTPEGSGIARVSFAGGATHPLASDVWFIGRDGSGLRRVADLGEGSLSLAWSGDGRKLYIMGTGGLWRLDPARGELERLRDGVANGQLVWLRD